MHRDLLMTAQYTAQRLNEENVQDADCMSILQVKNNI